MKNATELLATTLQATSPPALLALGGALALSIFWLCASSSRSKSALDASAKDPHRLPNSSMLLGDLSEYMANAHRLHDWMAETCASFGGEPWVIRIPRQKDTVIIARPEHMEDVFTTQFDNFVRGAFQFEYFKPLLGDAIVNSDGSRWYNQRKVAAGFFTARSLRVCMSTTMQKNMYQMCDVIGKTIAADGQLDLYNLLEVFALQTFAEVGLGVNMSWIGSETPNPLGDPVKVAGRGIVRRLRVPEFYWKLERFLNVGVERELAAAASGLRTYIRTIIDQSLAAVADQKTTGEAAEIKSVMELFVEQSHAKVEGMGPSDLTEFILTFVLAAQDTSTVTLSWLFLMVAKRPDIEAKIREEMAAMLPSMGVTKDTYLTTDHVQKLVYLDATIKEVLRLYPAFPQVMREAVNDTVLSGNVRIAKGTSVSFSTFSMARDINVWGPDASEFKPERWIDEATGKLKTVPSTQFATFSTGPRICIGMKLAMLELRVVTANLLHRYHFDLAQPNDGSYQASISLTLSNPLIVKVTPTTA